MTTGIAMKDSIFFDGDYEGSCIGSVSKLGEDFYSIDLRADTWYYFNFRMRGCKGREIIFTFTCREITSPGYSGGMNRWKYADGHIVAPVVSYDGGKTWEKTTDIYTGSCIGQYYFRHTYKEDEAIVSFGPMYTYTDLLSYLDRYCKHPEVTRSSIGKSRCGLDMPRLTVTRNPDAKKCVFVISREDADEFTGSAGLEGMLDYLVSDNDDARLFLDNYKFECIPMVSVDGVIAGTTHSAGYGDGGRWWHKENAPQEIENVRKLAFELADSGMEFALAGKFHGGMSLEPVHTIDYMSSSVKLHRAMRTHTTEFWNPIQTPAVISSTLTIRPLGYFERFMLDNFELYNVFAVHVQGTSFDNLRYCGRDLLKALFAFLEI